MSAVDNWVVMGGRRWSRIITEELCRLIDPHQFVSFQVMSAEPQLFEWWESNLYKDKIQIVEQLDACCPGSTGVAFVANSAYLHYQSIKHALEAGYNVITEKPMTFSGLESANLLRQSQSLGLKVFSTNTYLFADYLYAFREQYLQDNEYSHMHIDWSDPVMETRYGERKGYDSSVPIIYDVIPHLASLILIFYGKVNHSNSSLEVLNGGSKVKLAFEYNGLTITADISRNASQRQRHIRFSEADSEVVIDFTEEPGKVIIDGNDVGVSDPSWHLKRKPIAEMIFSVKQYFENNKLDDRLNTEAALFANDLIDDIAQEYVDKQISFLNSEIGQAKTADFAYAKQESFSLKTRAMQHLDEASPLKRLAMAAK